MRGTRKNKNPKTIAERLDENVKKIAKTEQLLKELKTERKELETAKKNEEIEALLSLIQEKGLTIEEAKECISELANEKKE